MRVEYTVYTVFWLFDGEKYSHIIVANNFIYQRAILDFSVQSLLVSCKLLYSTSGEKNTSLNTLVCMYLFFTYFYFDFFLHLDQYLLQYAAQGKNLYLYF